MFSPKVCPWSFYAILLAIFLSQTFYQPADGNENDVFAKIVTDFTGKVVKLNKPHSHKIHATGVVKNVEETLLKILVSDCDKLHQFLVEYKHFLHSAKKHYVSPNYIEDCDKQITIFEKVCFGVNMNSRSGNKNQLFFHFSNFSTEKCFMFVTKIFHFDL
jgi:hypothetical protein